MDSYLRHWIKDFSPTGVCVLDPFIYKDLKVMKSVMLTFSETSLIKRGFICLPMIAKVYYILHDIGRPSVALNSFM